MLRVIMLPIPYPQRVRFSKPADLPQNTYHGYTLSMNNHPIIDIYPTLPYSFRTHILL